MGQNFDQANRDNTFWPRPNIFTGSLFMKNKNKCVRSGIWTHALIQGPNAHFTGVFLLSLAP